MTTLRRTAMALALVALGGCITDPVTGKSVFGRPTSTLEEEQMGEQYRPVILQQFTGAYPDADAQGYLGGIVLGMAKHSVRPELQWSFTVLNDSTPNAFAVPGGEVFITRGLLWRLDDEAEFAVVMGHEIGHVEHRHSVQAMGRDPLVTILAQQLGQRVLGSADAGNLLASLGVSRFSRDQERESDVQGVHNAYQAGYDPRQGADVFRKFLQMKQQAGGSESIVDAWTSTHPLDSERIENIERLSREIDPRLQGDAPVEGLRFQTGRFAEIIAKVRGAQKVYDRHDAALAKVAKAGSKPQSVAAAIPELTACAQALPDHAYFANTVGKAYAISGNLEQARTWLQRASSLDQGLLEPEYLLGLVDLDLKQFGDAETHADRGLGLLPGNYKCLYVRGEANLGLGKKAQAESDFRAVVESAPPESEQYKAAATHLGVAPAKPAKKAKP